MSYWKREIKNFFISPESSRVHCTTDIDSLGKIEINIGRSMTLRLSMKDAMALRDAIAISVIKIQDGMNYSQDHSRVTNGDMG